MTQRHSATLLMTATIDPRDMVQTLRNDPLVRLQDYHTALRAWMIDPTVNRIVFCDNSGYDLSSLRELVDQSNPQGKDVEFLSYLQPPFPLYMGKSYGEAQIFAHALKNARLLQDDTRIIKMTGRLYVGNLSPLQAEQEREPDIFVRCNLAQYLTWSDCRVYEADKCFFTDYLIPRSEELDERIDYRMVHLVARSIHAAMADGHAWRMLPMPPQIRGISGTNDEKYSSLSPLTHAMHAVKTRVLARK